MAFNKNTEEEKEIKDKKNDLMNEKEKFYKEEGVSPEVKNILDEVFSEMTGTETPSEEPLIKDDTISESSVKTTKSTNVEPELKIDKKKPLDNSFKSFDTNELETDALESMTPGG